MALTLNEYEDLPLENPPVREVIFQVRFPPLLEIVEKLPTDFQRKIRSSYPDFKIRQSIGLEVDQALPNEYEFHSSNGLSAASLGFNFVSLTTKEYSHWMNFIEEIKSLLEAYVTSYEDENILTSRIGLRYVNEITPESVGVRSLEDLLDFLNNDLLCLIVNDGWSLPRKATYQLSIPDEESELTLRLAFNQDPQPRIILDFDYFLAFAAPIETTVEDVCETLRGFHKKIYSAFRWSIKENRIEDFNSSS